MTAGRGPGADAAVLLPRFLAALVVIAAASGSVRRSMVDARIRRRIALVPAGSGRRGSTIRRIVGAVRDEPHLAWLRPSTDVEHAQVLEAIARSMRAGSSLSLAIDDAVRALPHAAAVADLGRAAQSTRAGVPLARALEVWAATGRDDARSLAGAALTFGVALGGASAQALDAAASGLRDRAALAREVRALTSQARASAAVMVVAPVAFLALSVTTDPRAAHILFFTPTGLVCLVGGAVLDAAGAVWMARMARRVS